MKSCTDTPAEVMERYLRGELDEPAATAFEEHYFACDACFAALEDLRALRGELVRSREAVLATEAPIRPFSWLGLAAALLALGAAGAFLFSHGTPAPAPAPVAAVTATTASVLAELARVEPPSWAPVRLRGAEDDAARRFREGMELYGRGDLASALPVLREAATLDPSAPGASFYRGACALLAGETSEAVGSLGHVVALGETPYLQEARFYLAKARLAQGDVRAARSELSLVAGTESARQAEAARLLDRLDALVKDTR